MIKLRGWKDVDPFMEGDIKLGDKLQ